MRLDRRDDHAQLDVDQVEADDSHSAPRRDDDALIEHAIQDLDEGAVFARRASVNSHTALPGIQNSPPPMFSGRASYLPGLESLPVLYGSAGLWQDAVARHLTKLHEVLKDFTPPEL